MARSFRFGCMFKKREVEGQIAEDGGQHKGQTTTCICHSYRLYIFIPYCICSEASNNLSMSVASRRVVGKGTSRGTWMQIEEQDVFFSIPVHPCWMDMNGKGFIPFKKSIKN